MFLRSLNMKRLIVLLLGCTLYFSAIAQSNLFYLQQEKAIADSLYKVNNKKACFEHIRMAISYFCTHKNDCLKNAEVCKTVFEAYTSFCMMENPISTSERIECRAQALGIIEMNSNWVKSYPNKQHIIYQYICYIGDLVDANRIVEAQKANKSMVNFAERHYRMGLPDVLLSACSMNSLMKSFEQSFPLYKRLYGMFDDLDKVLQYKVVKELIHFEFKAKEYNEVINLATKHAQLIRQTNDEVKNSLLDLISLSFEKNAFAKEDRLSKDNFSSEVDDEYAKGYNWAKLNNETFLPRSIVYWAYYRYKWDESEDKAIPLFYEMLDILQNKNIEEGLFDRYCEVEDAQQAIISIIMRQILKASSPIDIKALMDKYDRIFVELITSQKGEYHNDLITVIESAFVICYGEEEILN